MTVLRMWEQPSQIYKWVSHNEYDDTKQKYSSISSGNSHNLKYSIHVWQIHYRNVLCSKGLLNHLLKNSDNSEVGKVSLWADQCKVIDSCDSNMLFCSDLGGCGLILSLVKRQMCCIWERPQFEPHQGKELRPYGGKRLSFDYMCGWCALKLTLLLQLWLHFWCMMSVLWEAQQYKIIAAAQQWVGRRGER